MRSDFELEEQILLHGAHEMELQEKQMVSRYPGRWIRPPCELGPSPAGLGRFGRQAVNGRVTPLNELVREVIDDLAPETANRKIEWRVGELPRTNCDPALMKVVFTNLLSNAVKFTRPRATAAIEVGQKMLNGELELFVQDNGAGFDMRYAGNLFGVFQRMHKEKDFEGTGVGLATVQRILQKHGGRIWAEAAPDRGATFYFTCAGAANREHPVAAGAGG